jgi:PAS domain-containing protein
LAVRLRQIAPVALVFGLTIVGFVVARLLVEHDAQRDSERRAEVLPWIIVAAGLGAAALTAALGRHAARRARAQAEVDRVFMLSRDLIAVASFDGYFTRVNPAAERILG